MPDDEGWLYRPMMRGLCRYESLLDGSIGMVDLAVMNDLVDVQDENDARARRAAEEQD
jgi:hypothetical protein